MRALATAILLVAGVGLEAVACVGLVAFRSTYDRLHCVAPAGYGALLVACAVVVRESFSLIGDKALASAVLLVLSGTVLVHSTARMARIRAHGDWRIQPGEDVEVNER